MLLIKEKIYQLTEIEAEIKDYDEAMEYVNELWSKGYVVDMITSSKKNDENNKIYFITAFKKTPVE